MVNQKIQNYIFEDEIDSLKSVKRTPADGAPANSQVSTYTHNLGLGIDAVKVLILEEPSAGVQGEIVPASISEVGGSELTKISIDLGTDPSNFTNPVIYFTPKRI